MKAIVGFLMISNAALFLLCAALHAGLAVGRLHEPRILPAAIVEILCAAALLWGAAGVLGTFSRWRAAIFANLFALSGVLLGIAALAAGAGPRTASNDLHHKMMLILIGASLAALILRRFMRSGRVHS